MAVRRGTGAILGGWLALGCSSAANHAADSGVPAADAAGFAWHEAAACPIARFEANAVVIDGEVWVMGGFVSASLDVTRRIDIYNPETDSWRAGPDLPGAETHIGAVAIGSDIVVVGGLGTSALTPSAEVWRWSAAAGQWIAGPLLPAAQAAFAWALIGGDLHVAGGLAADGQHDTDRHLVWTVDGAATWTDAPPLPDPRNHGGGATSGGLLYAVAGRHDWNEASGDDATVSAFDPATQLWTSRAPIPTARSEIAAATTAMADGRLLVVGGSIAGVHPNADALIYDPVADSWTALPPLPEPRKGAVATRIGARIVVTTGSPTSTDPSATTWVGCCL